MLAPNAKKSSLTNPSALPEPSVEAQQISARLGAALRQRIRANGGYLGFDDYMAQVLYAPKLGYYAGAAAKFGAGGDFVTAPLLGDGLGRCLAAQLAEILAELGADAGRNGAEILEIGAGSGELAAQILGALQQYGETNYRYAILETSPTLRARQQQTIAALPDPLAQRVTWRDKLPKPPWRGVVLANEVLDALPALRFEVRDGVAYQLGVGLENDELIWALGAPLEQSLQQRLRPCALTDRYRSEIGLRAEAWTRTLGGIIDPGVLLLIDYGFPRYEFYHPERADGTLMCHYRHRAHTDPFFYPGLQDLSVHIDFTAIRDAAIEAGLGLGGYTSQSAFLLALGVLDNLPVPPQPDSAPDPLPMNSPVAVTQTQQLQTLLMPQEMGELFKVIAFTRDFSPPLRGFSLRDRSLRL